jgi:hypothetical protein
MARRFRDKVERKFSLAQMTEKTLEVYREMKTRKRILVIKLGALGDVILAGPSLRMIRKKFPSAHISLLIDTRHAPVVSGCPYLNEIIPLDRTSSQALTLYAHLERLYLWSSTLNIPQKLKTKLDVGLAAEVSSEGVPMRSNALFSSVLNSLLVVPYSDSALPLSLNGGVLAHEYFHFLFNGLVIDFFRDQKDNKKIINFALTTPHENDQSHFKYETNNSEKKAEDWFVFAFIRGMNEGLADIWGWLYSEDANFIVPSLPIVEKMRDLEANPDELWTKTQMISAIVTKSKQGDAAESLAYSLGTQYARWAYKRITEVEGSSHLSDDKRNLWSNKIIERLVNYTHKNMDLSNRDRLVPSEFISYLLFGDDKLTSEECSRWSSFVEKSERSAAFSKNCTSGY